MAKPDPSTNGERPLADGEWRVPVAADVDIVSARQRARLIARELGFTAGDATIVATAISELARNIVDYARSGAVILRCVEAGPRRGLVIVAEDEGPGIADVALAMRDGFSTAGRLGLGLPGVRRLMDEFEIESKVGAGTRVTVKKWTS